MKNKFNIFFIIMLFLFINISNIHAITDEVIEKIKNGEVKLTYDLMGAKGDGATNDYAAIQATHDLANKIYIENNIMLTVYGTKGKTYYISVADKPIKVITNVDWQNCNFIFDDYVDLNNDGENDVNTGNSVFYITSNMSFETELLGLSNNVYFTNIVNELNSLNFKINKDTKDYSKIVQALKNNSQYQKQEYRKKDYDNSRYWGVNIIAEEPYMYIRSGSSSNNGDLQRETILIDSITGENLTDMNWDYNSFSRVEVFPIRNEEIEVKNARFLTLTNNIAYTNNGIKKDYNHRNIKVQYSGNVRISNIKHKLDENAHLNINEYQDNPDGNAYAGFIATNSAALINIKDVYLSSHIMPSPSKWGSSYDLRFDNSVYIYVDNVNYFCDTVDSECYSEYMQGTRRWGIMSSNYIKNLTIKNSKMNRVDSHKGVTNLYVKDSTIGLRGFTLTGKGTAYIKNTTIDDSKNVVLLRNDYGSTFEGNIIMKNITYKPRNISTISIVGSNNNQSHYYGYLTYFPNTFIDGLSIKNENKDKLSEIDLISLADNPENSDEKQRYYFKGTVYAQNVTIDDKKIQLFPKKFDKRNYSISTYGGNNIVKLSLDSKIEKDSSLLSLENSKFKLDSSVENVSDYVEGYFEKLSSLNYLSNSKVEFNFSNISIDMTKKILSNINNNTKIKSLFDTTKNNNLLKIFSKDNELQYSEEKSDANALLATGQYVKYYDINDGIITYKVSVSGDVSGDGKISSQDYIKIKNHIMNTKLIIGDEYLLSADYNNDSKISSLDYVKIKNYIMNT